MENSHRGPTPYVDIFCDEVLDLYDEPLPKIQKISNKVVESLPISAKDVEMFFALLEDEVITSFLEYDRYCQYADRYLLAMVMTYFKRAGLSYEEYTPYNFFVALHLAHDMEEDKEELKYAFLQWAFGAKWEEKQSTLLAKRDELWISMNYRGLVSKKCCEEVVSMLPNHPVWQRHRHDKYGGAKREFSSTWGANSPITRSESASSSSEYTESADSNEEYEKSSLRKDATPYITSRKYNVIGQSKKCLKNSDLLTLKKCLIPVQIDN